MDIDPVCAFHGKKWSEHEHGRCLYCVVCFETLTPETCYHAPDGAIYDLCQKCGEGEFGDD